MRKDMAKVVTERPRHGMRLKHPRGERKQEQKYRLNDYEDAPCGEKIRFKWKKNWSGKEFSDLLGPLRGYLDKKVGCKWDDVYSEICKTLPANSVQGSHIRDHIDSMVEQNVLMIDGIPCSKHAYSYGMPLSTSSKFYNVFYVDPVDGILKSVPHDMRRKHTYKGNPDMIVVSDKVQHHKIDGIWYEVQVQKVLLDIYSKTQEYVSTYRKNYRYTVTSFYYDDKILGKKFTNKSYMLEAYGGNYKGVSKRQLNGQELKKYDLHNNSMLAA